MREPQKCVTHNVFHPLGPTCTPELPQTNEKYSDPKEKHRTVTGTVAPYFNNAAMPVVLNIPVRWADETIGTASLDSTGHMEIVFDRTDTAERVQGLFRSDGMDHISLDSSIQPAKESDEAK